MSLNEWTTGLLLHKNTSTSKEILTNEVELPCKDASATVSNKLLCTNRLNTTSI